MQNEEILKLALTLKSAQDENYQIEPITNEFPTFSIEDAYKVSNEIHKLKLKAGFKALGRKIGFTNSLMWDTYGVEDPVWSYMYDKTVEYFQEEKLFCDISSMSEAKLEPEIILCFAKPPKHLCTLEELVECIDWVSFGYEIVQCHYPNWKFKASDVIADVSLHAKLYVGEKIKVQDLENPIEQLENFEVKIFCDDEELETGYGFNVLNSPLQAILYLLEVLRNQDFGEPLKEGEIVTTGTLTQAFTLKKGQVYSSQISGINLKDLTLEIKE